VRVEGGTVMGMSFSSWRTTRAIIIRSSAGRVRRVGAEQGPEPGGRELAGEDSTAFMFFSGVVVVVVVHRERVAWEKMIYIYTKWKKPSGIEARYDVADIVGS